jgi:hypothetical protein
LRPCKRCLRSGKETSCVSSSSDGKEHDQDMKFTFPKFESNIIPPHCAFPSFNMCGPGIQCNSSITRMMDFSLKANNFPVTPASSSEVKLLAAMEGYTGSPSCLPHGMAQPAFISNEQRIQQQQIASRSSELSSASLGVLIAHQQEQIRALVSRLPPNAALDNLLLSAMLASPSTAPSFRISAALDAVATAAAAASISSRSTAGTGPYSAAPQALPSFPLPWSLPPFPGAAGQHLAPRMST